MAAGAVFQGVASSQALVGAGAVFQGIASAQALVGAGAVFQGLAESSPRRENGIGPSIQLSSTTLRERGTGPSIQLLAFTSRAFGIGPSVRLHASSLRLIGIGPSLFIEAANLDQDKFQSEPVVLTLLGPLGRFQSEPVDTVTLDPNPVPVVTNVDLVQRDSLSTYLSDVTFDVYDPSGNTGQEVLLEWKIGIFGTYQVATFQVFDRKHDPDANVLNGVPVVPPGASYNLVWSTFSDLPDGVFEDIFLRVTVSNPSEGSAEGGPFSVSTEAVEEEPFADRLSNLGLIDSSPDTFLGNGLIQPLRRESTDFSVANGIPLVEAAIQQLLGTRAAVGKNVGELPWRPNFGSKFWVLRHRPQNAHTEQEARGYAKEAMLLEPRAEITDVAVETNRGEQQGELRIAANYAIISGNTQLNRVVVPSSGQVGVSLGSS